MITIIGTLLIVLASVGVGLLIDRKWGVLPRKERLLEAGRSGLRLPGYAPGEAPSTAIEVSPAALETLRRKKCDACRGDTEALADDHVTYDDRVLLVVHSRCHECGARRSTYVRPS